MSWRRWVSGRLADRYGPAPALLAGPGLFLAGLLASGVATGMPLLLTGRALQGLGLGTQTVAVHVLVALVYPHRSWAAVFGLLVAAWVVPSLIGLTWDSTLRPRVDGAARGRAGGGGDRVRR